MIIISLILISSLLSLDNDVDLNNDSSYYGGWPYNDNKDNIIGPELEFECPQNIGCQCKSNNDCINGNCLSSPKGLFCYPKNGDVFPSFVSVDQYDEIVSIYDFANQGKYILVELGTVWCTPCNLLANWIAYNDQEIASKGFWKPEYQKIYDMIHNDEIYFITILYEDENRENATYQTIYEWYDNYPDENVPLFIDKNKLLHTWIKPSGIPAVTLLDENMNIVNISTRGLNSSFDKLLNLLENHEE